MGKTDSILMREAIQQEQVKILYSTLPIGLLVTLVNASILVAVQWTVVSRPLLIGWLGLLFFVTTIRSLFWYFYRKTDNNKKYANFWRRSFLIGAITAGLVWGAGGYLLFTPDSTVNQVFLAFVLAGMCAGAVSTLSAMWATAVGFILPCLTPLILRFFSIEDVLSQVMGAMSLLFLSAILSSARHYFNATLQNITLRFEAVEHEKALNKSRQHLALHLMRTPLAAIEWDTDFRVVSWNPGAERIFGYTAEQAMGKKGIDLLVPEVEQKAVVENWRQLLENAGGWRSDSKNITADGRIIECEWYNTPLIEENGKVIGVASLSQDITDRVKAEIDLLKAKEMAEEANKAKSAFLSNMSHELRTPLNAIIGFGEFLQTEERNNFSVSQKESIDAIVKAGGHLLGLVNQLLDLSKIENGRLDVNIDEVDVRDICAECLNLVTPIAQQLKISISEFVTNKSNKAPILVQADYMRLKQVLINLLSNAIKYNTDGGRVSLRVETSMDKNIRISVADTGLGIAAEDMSKLFKPFSRIKQVTRYVEGTGIGLVTSKELIELMGGSIGVDSQPGKGSTFWVELKKSETPPLLPVKESSAVVG